MFRVGRSFAALTLTADRSTPTQVSIAGVRQAAAGGEFSCARKADGTVACWGAKGYGQLGISSAASTASPVAVVL